MYILLSFFKYNHIRRLSWQFTFKVQRQRKFRLSCFQFPWEPIHVPIYKLTFFRHAISPGLNDFFTNQILSPRHHYPQTILFYLYRFYNDFSYVYFILINDKNMDFP